MATEPVFEPGEPTDHQLELTTLRAHLEAAEAWLERMQRTYRPRTPAGARRRGLLHIAEREHADPAPRPPNTAEATARHADEGTGRLGTLAAMAEHGRGLEIMRALADGCGLTSVTGRGSVYWATLRTGGRPIRAGPAGSAVTETIVVNACRELRHRGQGWTVRLHLAWRADHPSTSR